MERNDISRELVNYLATQELQTRAVPIRYAEQLVKTSEMGGRKLGKRPGDPPLLITFISY